MMPLVKSFQLSTKKGKEVWVEPSIERTAKAVSFGIRHGPVKTHDGTITRRGVRCMVCGESAPLEHVRTEGKAGRMGAQMLAIVAEGVRCRVYLPPCEEHVQIAKSVQPPDDVPETDLIYNSRHMTPPGYGMTKHRHLFTNRQLTALATFSDLVKEARLRVLHDSNGDKDYADAVATYLAFGLSKLSDMCNSLCSWGPTDLRVRHLFSRQAIPINWDFAETNPLVDAAGGYAFGLDYICKSLLGLPTLQCQKACVSHLNAVSLKLKNVVISSDPPYYDNVPYADLSDFFYVWLKRTLKDVYPDLFSTLLVPKAEELVADPFRHKGKDKAREFFEVGMGEVFRRMRDSSNPDFPATIYYAFKQSESEDGEDDSAEGDDASTQDHASTGWETMLQGMIQAGWQITGTWPMRTELANRMRSMDSNALASSIVLVCRPRPADALSVSRRDFMSALRRELPEALRKLQHGNIAPVDLAQASIGPGMAVYSRYSKVLEADGSSMRVRPALAIINKTLDDVLAEQEGEFDTDTRWAVAWFEQFGMADGPYGTAETLSRAKNTSVQGMVEAGVAIAKSGVVRLLRRDELPEEWDPRTDKRLAAWEAAQHLIRVMESKGEAGASELLRLLGSKADPVRDLAYRLYTVCERKGWTKEAFAYNSLVIAWPEIARLAVQLESAQKGKEQGELF